jgi:putative endonuclease
MYYVYVLKSERDKKRYIGYTKDLKKRFVEHQNKMVKSTKSRVPFSLIYYEAYKSEADAKNREFQLKRGKRAYEQLYKRIPNCI